MADLVPPRRTSPALPSLPPAAPAVPVRRERPLLRHLTPTPFTPASLPSSRTFLPVFLPPSNVSEPANQASPAPSRLRSTSVATPSLLAFARSPSQKESTTSNRPFPSPGKVTSAVERRSTLHPAPPRLRCRLSSLFLPSRSRRTPSTRPIWRLSPLRQSKTPPCHARPRPADSRQVGCKPSTASLLAGIPSSPRFSRRCCSDLGAESLLYRMEPMRSWQRAVFLSTVSSWVRFLPFFSSPVDTDSAPPNHRPCHACRRR
jgi:hypothetical protein